MTTITQFSNWYLEAAIEACRELEPVLAPLGLHVALTGGCLYKDCPRKDLDVILYRHSGMELAEFHTVMNALVAMGITTRGIYRNVIKCCWESNDEYWQLDLILRAGVSWPITEACPEGSSDAIGYFKQGQLPLGDALPKEPVELAPAAADELEGLYDQMSGGDL